MDEKTVDQVKRQKSYQKKKYVRLKEGAEMYSVGHCTFEKLVKVSGAGSKFCGVVLVNTEVIDDYLESIRDEPIAEEDL